MTEWDQLVKNSILGTGQYTAGLPTVTDPALQASLDACGDRSPEQQLLAAMSIITTYRQAGSSLWQTLALDNATDTTDITNIANITTAAQPENQAYCTDAVRAILRKMMADNDIQLIQEALTVLVKAKQIVTLDLLPDLMTLAKDHIDIRALVSQTMGQRGSWLCRQNTDWGKVLIPSDNTDWQIEQGVKRQLILQQARAQDATAARQALEVLWASESARERLLLLEGLQTRLADDDLPFLRQCEKDRSHGVRQLAARFRLLLGDNPLQHTLLTELGKIIRVNGQQLQVILPDGFDNNWQNIGLQEQKSYSAGKLGQKTGWVFQFLLLVNPQVLAQQLGCSMPTLVQALQDSDYAVWLVALDQTSALLTDIDYFSARYALLPTAQKIEWLSTHIEAYPFAVIEPILFEWLKPCVQIVRTRWYDVLALVIQAAQKVTVLPPDLSELAVNACNYQLSLHDKHRGSVYYAIDRLGYVLHLDVYHNITQFINAGINTDRFLILSLIYQQRFDLHKEFNL